MIQVIYGIGDKDKDNNLMPLFFQIQFVSSKELKYVPKFLFQKKYSLPHKIIFYKKKAVEGSNEYRKMKCGFTSNKLSLRFNLYISPSNLRKINKYYHNDNLLNDDVCGQKCFGCIAYLSYNLKESTYFDFMIFFQEVAKDLYNAWNDAVRMAKESVEYEKESVVITSM